MLSFNLFSFFLVVCSTGMTASKLQVPHMRSQNRKSDVQFLVVSMFVSQASSLRLYALSFPSLTFIIKPQFQINPAVGLLCLWTTKGFFFFLISSPSRLAQYFFLLLYLSPTIICHLKVEIFLSPFHQGNLLILPPKTFSSLSAGSPLIKLY